MKETFSKIVWQQWIQNQTVKMHEYKGIILQSNKYPSVVLKYSNCIAVNSTVQSSASIYSVITTCVALIWQY